ncbi:PadR family transcriptional regulator [Levilactobacillus humaensis]|uniref:PadR family transcriptional regulator n=1 Tax=Levilactobacillus humaensis TaxID=2950375 RepID=UPI0021C48E73|nr:PadR family transcriptional regulator [Levilactobacillus humaensis]
MYHLFVLGQLMDHAMTGYQLRKALAAAVGQEQTMSYGVLYPLLERLAAAGEVTLTEKTEGQRQKRWVAITDRGRDQFHQLIVIPVVRNKQTQLWFQIKMMGLHLLSPADRRLVLTDFQTCTQEQLAHWQHVHDYFSDQPNMVPGDVADGLQLNQLQQQQTQVQLDWITQQLTRLDKGE